MTRVDDRAPVMGVDGCRAGWVGALLSGTTYDVLVAAGIASLVAEARDRRPGLAVVAIDIPIGLPDDRPRHADSLARARLPRGRKSSVFPTPSRAAAASWPRHTTHPAVSRANREALGTGLSIQAFNLVPKILDVDRYVRSDPPMTVLEVHPEVSLAAIDPACVVPSKAGPVGRSARRRALGSLGLEIPTYTGGQGFGPDDLIDACAVAWTAARYVEGAAVSLPDPPEMFSDGIRAAIWV
jgi:predicted RNase H-like nuclease